MKALTVRQPLASLIVRGVKTVENRSWPVPKGLPLPFRLAIHAATTWAPGWRGWMDVDDPRLYDLEAAGAQIDESSDGSGYWRAWGPSLPTGVVLGTVLVPGCHAWEDCLVGTAPQGAGGCSPWAEDEAYHWTLADPQPFPEPVPAKGRLGLWTWDDPTARAFDAAAEEVTA